MRSIFIALVAAVWALSGIVAGAQETPEAAGKLATAQPSQASQTPEATLPLAPAQQPEAAPSVEIVQAPAETPAPKTQAPKPVPAAKATPAPKTPPAAKAVPPSKAVQAVKGSKIPAIEQLTCRTGPNDEQARLVVEAVKGRPMEFAFYSRLGTKVCSIHGRRGDFYTKWEDQGEKSVVKLLAGSAELEYKPGHAKLKFLDVGRMQYCGMYGELNGVVEVVSTKSECGLDGIFD